MLEFYKTDDFGKHKIDTPEEGCWINVVSPTEDEKTYLIETLSILPEFIKSSLDPEESPHIDFDDDVNQTLVMVDYPIDDTEYAHDGFSTLQYTTAPLGIIILKKYIVTVSIYDNKILQDLKNFSTRGLDTRFKTRFLLMLMLKIAQYFLAYLRQIDRISTRTENKMYKSMRNKELIQMLGLSKSLVYFSTSLKSDEITLNKIMRGKYITIYEDDNDLFEDLLIEMRQAIDMCKIYSNILSSTIDSFANLISNNLNIVMKVLTVITIVMSIPNIIFGFYGMNVVDLPFNFVLAPILITFVLASIAILIFSKLKMFK